MINYVCYSELYCGFNVKKFASLKMQNVLTDPFFICFDIVLIVFMNIKWKF